MSFGDYLCPLPAALTEIPASECPFNINQLVKMWIYRDIAGAAAPFATVAGAETALAVTALFDAVDDTKFVSTPIIENMEIPTAEEVTEGGGSNATPFGIEIVTGMNPIVVNTPMFREITPEIVRALKTLNGEPNLRAFFVNEFGRIYGEEVTDGGEFQGVKLRNFTVKEPQRLGKNTNDKTPFRFNLDYGWGDKLAVAVPSDYDAIYDY